MKARHSFFFELFVSYKRRSKDSRRKKVIRRTQEVRTDKVYEKITEKQKERREDQTLAIKRQIEMDNHRKSRRQ